MPVALTRSSAERVEICSIFACCITDVWAISRARLARFPTLSHVTVEVVRTVN